MDTDKIQGRETQGCSWASQAGAGFSNPFASELARDSETPSLILLRKWPCFARETILKYDFTLFF
jgi:hypothetical protein